MKALIIVASILLMTGCGSTKIVYKDKFIILDIPTLYLNQCNVTKPPVKLDYIKLNQINKEMVLADYSMSLLSDLSECNIQQTGLKDWYTEQKKIYSTGNKQ